jgi:anti-sigma regulatory factor (Ser/Thr protein kinase)
MQHRCLTVDLVKDMLYAWDNHELVRATVAGLRQTTLPGIIEYRSLVWDGRDNVPPLPPAVMNSEIGGALHALEIHLQKNSGERPEETRTIACRAVEFTMLTQRNDILARRWELFAARFNRSAQKAGLPRVTAGHLHGALAEMAENALIHAKTSFPIVVGYHVSSGFAQFSVIDIGIGVLASLRSCPAYAYLKTDTDALRTAMQDGVSRFGYEHGGLGFRPVFKAVAAQYGMLRFRSGQGCIVIDGTHCTADKGKELFVPLLPGFHVTVSCSLRLQGVGSHVA